MRTRNRPKPEIKNFRVKWDKVADLAVQASVALVTVWFMVVFTVLAFRVQ